MDFGVFVNASKKRPGSVGHNCQEGADAPGIADVAKQADAPDLGSGGEYLYRGPVRVQVPPSVLFSYSIF
jgi:hypothetical protein